MRWYPLLNTIGQELNFWTWKSHNANTKFAQIHAMQSTERDECRSFWLPVSSLSLAQYAKVFLFCLLPLEALPGVATWGRSTAERRERASRPPLPNCIPSYSNTLLSWRPRFRSTTSWGEFETSASPPPVPLCSTCWRGICTLMGRGWHTIEHCVILYLLSPKFTRGLLAGCWPTDCFFGEDQWDYWSTLEDYYRVLFPESCDLVGKWNVVRSIPAWLCWRKAWEPCIPPKWIAKNESFVGGSGNKAWVYGCIACVIGGLDYTAEIAETLLIQTSIQ